MDNANGLATLFLDISSDMPYCQDSDLEQGQIVIGTEFSSVPNARTVLHTLVSVQVTTFLFK